MSEEIEPGHEPWNIIEANYMWFDGRMINPNSFEYKKITFQDESEIFSQTLDQDLEFQGIFYSLIEQIIQIHVAHSEPEFEDKLREFKSWVKPFTKNRMGNVLEKLMEIEINVFGESFLPISPSSTPESKT